MANTMEDLIRLGFAVVMPALHFFTPTQSFHTLRLERGLVGRVYAERGVIIPVDRYFTNVKGEWILLPEKPTTEYAIGFQHLLERGLLGP